MNVSGSTIFLKSFTTQLLYDFAVTLKTRPYHQKVTSIDCVTTTINTPYRTNYCGLYFVRTYIKNLCRNNDGRLEKLRLLRWKLNMLFIQTWLILVHYKISHNFDGRSVMSDEDYKIIYYEKWLQMVTEFK